MAEARDHPPQHLEGIRIALVPTPILWPVVFALSVIGVYAFGASLLNVRIVLIVGVIGFRAPRHGFAVCFIKSRVNGIFMKTTCNIP